jgi:hypothetical protein
MNEVLLNFSDGIITPTSESDKAKSNGHVSMSEPLPEMVWTDDGLTLKFTETYGDLRYVAPFGKWRQYIGGCGGTILFSLYSIGPGRSAAK